MCIFFSIPYMPATIWHQLYISVLHVYQLNGLHRCWSLVYTNNNFKHIFVSVCFNKLISLDNRVAHCFLNSFMECHICNIFATWTLPFDLRYYTEFTVFVVVKRYISILPISFRIISFTLGHSYDYPSAGEANQKATGKYIPMHSKDLIM